MFFSSFVTPFKDVRTGPTRQHLVPHEGIEYENSPLGKEGLEICQVYMNYVKILINIFNLRMVTI